MQRKREWLRYIAIGVVVVLICATIYGFVLQHKARKRREQQVVEFCQTLRQAMETSVALHTEIDGRAIDASIDAPMMVESELRVGLPGEKLLVVSSEKKMNLKDDTWAVLFLKGKTARIIFAAPEIIDHRAKTDRTAEGSLLEINRWNARIERAVEEKWTGLKTVSARVETYIQKLAQQYLDGAGYRDVKVEVLPPSKTPSS